MEFDELPEGLGMAFAMNPAAMNAYSMLSEPEKESFIKQARSVSSKEEMREIVAGLTAIK